MSKIIPTLSLGLLALGLSLAVLPNHAGAQQINSGVGANVSTAPQAGGLLRQPISRCIRFEGETRAKCESQEGKSSSARPSRNRGR